MRGEHAKALALPAAAAAVLLIVHFGAGPVAAEDTAPPGGATETAPGATTSPEAPAVAIVSDHQLQGVLGREVRSASDENMGRIVDVLVDHSGEVHAAIIDFGGFLGVGSRKIAVDWNALNFPPPSKNGARVTLELTRDQVNAAPEYQEGKPVVVLGALGKLEPLPE
jgi:hypothetical protein